MEDQKSRDGLTRREFLKTAGTAAGSVGAAVLGWSGFSRANFWIQKDVTLNVLMVYSTSPTDIAFWTAVTSAYQKRNPRVRVEVAVGSPQKLETDLAGNVPLDVIAIDTKRIIGFAQAGILRELNDLIKNSSYKPSAYYPSQTAKVVFQGTWYAVPLDQGACPIFINKALFKKAKVPLPPTNWGDPSWTFEKFLETARALTHGTGAKRIWGFQVQGWWVYVLPWVWSHGGHIVDHGLNKFTLLTPKVVEAFQMYQDLVLKYKVSPSPAVSSTGVGFNSGNVAMFSNGPWGIRSALNAHIDVDFVPYPSWGAPAVTRTPSDCLTIPRSAKNVEQAWDFIQFVVGPVGQSLLAKVAGRQPALIAEQAAFANQAKGLHWQVFFDGLGHHGHGTPLPIIFQKMDLAFSSVFNDFLLGKTSAEKMLAGLEPQFQSWLSAVPRPWRTDPRPLSA